MLIYIPLFDDPGMFMQFNDTNVKNIDMQHSHHDKEYWKVMPKMLALKS